MAMDVDKEILIGFIEETKSYIPRILNDIENFNKDSSHLDAVEEAYRFVHTIKGASSMLGLSALSHVSYFIEEVLGDVKTGQMGMSQDTVLFLQNTINHINTYINGLLSGESQERPILADVTKSFRRLKGLSESEDEQAIRKLAADGGEFPPVQEGAQVKESNKTPTPENPVDEVSHLEEGISSELLEVFTLEAKEHLENTSRLLSDLEKDPGRSELLQEVRRSVHTIKGAAGMVGFGSVSRLAHRMEDLLDRLYDGDTELSSDVMSLLFTTSDTLDNMVSGNFDGGKPENVLEELYEHYSGLLERESTSSGEVLKKEVMPEGLTSQEKMVSDPTGNIVVEERVDKSYEALKPEEPTEKTFQADEIPPELIEVFMIEANEHLENISHSLSELDKNPGRSELLQEVRRSVHTIKGAAGMVGFGSVSKLAHRMEDLLDRLYDGDMELSQDVMKLLFTTSDTLDNMVINKTGKETSEGDLQKLYGVYSHLLGGTQYTKSVLHEADLREEIKTESVDEEEAPNLAGVDSQVKDSSKYPKKDAKPTIRKPGEFVRIPIERLDELVNLISELVVNRSTFEQHFGRFTQEVDELRPSVDRLRRVSTKMETQYEVINLGGGKFARYGKAAVGMSRPQPVTSSVQEFDELEFDRYTEFHLLSRELTETTTDIGAVHNELRYVIGDFDSYLDRQGRLTSEIQDKLMHLRMVPLATLVTRLHRTVRVTAAQQGKLVDFMVEGEDVELDKTVLEEMADPLLHILRNAVDHGIEPPNVREVMGKPERGQILLRAYYEGTQVVIQVRDDGAGLDPEALRSAAVSGGFVSEAEAPGLSDEELCSLIFLAGFSTAREVSEISGRGVGMDVVKSTVHKMKGTVAVNSTPGKGVALTIRLPMTLAITRVLMVRANNETFAVPMGAVIQISRIQKNEIELLGQEEVVRSQSKVYPLIRLGEVLDLKQPSDGSLDRFPVLILNLGEKQVALVVDKLLEAREIVIKSLGSHLRRVRGITGATLMGDGTVVLILNPGDLVTREAKKTEFQMKPPVRITRDHATKDQARGVLDVLIVDDSVSVRRVMSNFVKKAGWNPIVAKDGVEALEIIQRLAKNPDIILLDIEMPRMDGYELTSTLRAQKSYKDIPIVMITSRAGEKHRQKAFELGATEYLVKPYQDEVLLGVIRQLTYESRGKMVQ